MNSIVSTRRYDIDALRVLAFGLLILYHIGMFYVENWSWHLKSEYTVAWLKYPMIFVNQWRMPLLFLISGFAISFLIQKFSAKDIAKSRTWKLLIPLVFGLLVVVPPQVYLQTISNGSLDAEVSYIDFLYRYFSFQSWPHNAFAGSDIGITWNHLWYLPYVWFYTLIFIVLFSFRHVRCGRIMSEFIGKLKGCGIILLPLIPFMIIHVALYRFFSAKTHDFINDWFWHANYFTFFIYGYLLSQNSDIWQELARRRKYYLLVATIAYVFVFFVNPRIYSNDFHYLVKLLFSAAYYLNRWLWILVILSWAYAYLNKPYRWTIYANKAVYSWYILHQTIIVVAGFFLAKLSLGGIIEAGLMLLITLTGCYLIYEFLLRRFSLLWVCFGHKQTKPIKISLEKNGVIMTGCLKSK